MKLSRRGGIFWLFVVICLDPRLFWQDANRRVLKKLKSRSKVWSVVKRMIVQRFFSNNFWSFFLPVILRRLSPSQPSLQHFYNKRCCDWILISCFLASHKRAFWKKKVFFWKIKTLAKNKRNNWNSSLYKELLFPFARAWTFERQPFWNIIKTKYCQRRGIQVAPF